MPFDYYDLIREAYHDLGQNSQLLNVYLLVPSLEFESMILYYTYNPDEIQFRFLNICYQKMVDEVEKGK